ncbi:copper resistance protein CopC [Kibdelosporangium philippinense]|uniref:Copper resistance protein CopC n=1 Tax=Kibdelosporangium philippinense TaxID=211113 RepID=A0ABS8ZH78_9PSEU|nr:copper resistance CopC family protein [Kibdelosporangium philippinense]MCE7007178.1 copper resistance protein CopC [Kibdelosporangium philippinense]
MTLRTLLLVVALLVATAIPASAHVRLLASNPEPGQALDKPPSSVQLTFDEPLKVAPTITVTDPNGTPWSMGRPTQDLKVVTVPADAPYGPAGKYIINYRVTGQDGHLVTGDIVFDITVSFGQPLAVQPEQPPAAQPQPQPQPGHEHTAASKQDEGGVPIGLWIFGVAVVLGIALAIVIRQRRKSDKPAL